MIVEICESESSQFLSSCLVGTSRTHGLINFFTAIYLRMFCINDREREKGERGTGDERVYRDNEKERIPALAPRISQHAQLQCNFVRYTAIKPRERERERRKKKAFRGLDCHRCHVLVLVIGTFDRRLLQRTRVRLLSAYGAAKISKRNSSIRRTRAARRSFPSSPPPASPPLPPSLSPRARLRVSSSRSRFFSAARKDRDKITPRHPPLARPSFAPRSHSPCSLARSLARPR